LNRARPTRCQRPNPASPYSLLAHCRLLRRGALSLPQGSPQVLGADRIVLNRKSWDPGRRGPHRPFSCPLSIPRLFSIRQGPSHCVVLKRNWIAPGEAHLFVPHRRGSSLRDSRRFFDARQRVSHPHRAARLSHRERRIASIIVTALAAPKIPRNKRSPRANARPHPKAASAASASSSRRLGAVQGSFI